MKKNTIIVLITVLLISTACQQNVVLHNKDFLAMSTVVTYQVYSDENLDVDTIIEESIIGTEKLMSRTDQSSEIYNINKLAGTGEKVYISDDVKKIIEVSLYHQKISGNAFRITIYPLVILWDIMNPDAPIPTQSKIEEAITLSRVSNLEYNENEGYVKMQDKGSGIDLGGIAKGYAVDKAVEKLKENDVKHGFISIGGGIQTFGGKPDGAPWVLGLQNPTTPQRGHFATYKLMEGAVVTSGDYQRRKIEGGVVYHHIIDPLSGYPVQEGLASVTIFADHSTDADAYSTAVYVMGFEKGLEFINEKTDVEAMFVFHDKSVYLTAGLKDKVEIVDTEFYLNENR